MSAPEPATARVDDSRKARVVIITVALASFIIPFTSSSVNVALPAIGRDFTMDAVTLGWVATSFLLAAAAFQVPFGRLGDIYGRRRLFLTGGAIFVLASAGLVFAPSSPVVIGLRVMQGIGGAMQFGTGVAMMTSVLPPQERGRALGFNTASVYIGLSIGPVIGGFLTSNVSWRSIFIVTVALGVAVFILATWAIRGEWSEARGERFDLTGAVIFCLMLTAVMYGFTELPAATGGVLIALGLVGVGLFAWWERRVASPVLDLKLFTRNIAFAFSNLAALIHYSATFAVAFILSLYLQYVKVLTAQEAGLVLIAQPVMMAIFSPIFGRLSDRIEPRIVASIGMGVSVIGLALLISVNAGTAIWYIVMVNLVLGLGFALFSAPNTNAVMGSVERKFFGVASGMLGTMRSIGMMFSLGIAMLVFSVVMGRVQVTPDVHTQFLESLRVILIIFVVLCAGGVAASMARGKVRQ
ncbi:MAG: MFS transporter [Chloroflexota bacterium]